MHAVPTQRTAFVPPEVLGPYFKPHSALGIDQYHGVWADKDASEKVMTMMSCGLVHFLYLKSSMVVLQRRCTRCPYSAQAVHRFPPHSGPISGHRALAPFSQGEPQRTEGDVANEEMLSEQDTEIMMVEDDQGAPQEGPEPPGAEAEADHEDADEQVGLAMIQWLEGSAVIVNIVTDVPSRM